MPFEDIRIVLYIVSYYVVSYYIWLIWRFFFPVTFLWGEDGGQGWVAGFLAGLVTSPVEVGFGLANSQRNTLDPAELRGQKGHLPQEVTMKKWQRRQSK